MKIAALAVFCVLIALPTEAGSVIGKIMFRHLVKTNQTNTYIARSFLRLTSIDNQEAPRPSPEAQTHGLR